MEQSPLITDGILIKVRSVDHETGTIQGALSNGRAANVPCLHGNLPAVNDIILFGIGNGAWVLASDELWLETNSIGIVRKVLEDSEVLLEDEYRLVLCESAGHTDIAVGNTVEFNSADGIIRVLHPHPIRIREFDPDEEEVLSTYRVDTSNGELEFSDFGGYPAVKERARQLIETQFKRRKYLDEIGAQPVKGILFTGPPGTGKTYLAKIIAHESKADFFLISGPSIVSKWLGDTESTLRMIFDAAKQGKATRAIIFFDEIDSIAERRSGDSHEASRRLVAQLLTLMDGFVSPEKSIVVIAATNRADALDPALMRPGRFDWEIEFKQPTLKDRYEILEVSAKRLRVEDDLPLEDIAFLTEDWSAADLKLLWTEAALLAAEDERGRIAGEDLALAYEQVASRSRRRSVPMEAGAT